MNLRYINIWLNPETGFDTGYRYEFLLYTRFISNYLSKKVRKYKIVTDGTFKMISVEPTPNKLVECRIVPEDVLKVAVPFNKERYENIKGTANYEYYLALLETGFKKVSEFKTIPLDTLLNLIDDFRKSGYKNEWLHKKKRFKQQDIEVALHCYFTTLDFRLVATINKISTKEKLCSGTVLITDPDEICFDKMFNDILINKEKIIITDSFNSPRILINLKDVLNNKFSFEVLEEDEV